MEGLPDDPETLPEPSGPQDPEGPKTDPVPDEPLELDTAAPETDPAAEPAAGAEAES